MQDKRIPIYLQQGRIKRALHAMQDLAASHRLGQYYTPIDNLLTNYDLLSHYYIDGVEDPERNKLLQRIKKDSSLIWEELQEEIKIATNIGFPYTQIREAKNQKENVSLELLYNYHEGLCERTAYEEMLQRIFNFLLTTTESTHDTLCDRIVNDAKLHTNEKCLAVTALSLNLWRRWNKEHYHRLLGALRSADMETQARALCGICISILIDPDKYTAEDLYIMLMDYPLLNRKIETIIRLIIRTAGTKQLTEKLRTEILPDLMKAGQKMQDHLDLASKEEDFNPNWIKSQNDDELEAKIREFGELQMSGADVYFANFAELKRLSFFQQPCAWFLPFDKRNSAIATLFVEGKKSVLDVFIENGTLCNSDKYSFCLSIQQMPDTQRQLIQSQLGNELEEQIAEGIQKLSTEDLWIRTANQYIQDLYRFFELFPAQAPNYRNPFKRALTWNKTPLFTHGVLSMSQQIALADKLFAEQHYAEALTLYHQWENDCPSASIYQKMGFATEKLSGDRDVALNFYRKADLLQPNDRWTTKRMAHIMFSQGDYASALPMYEELHRSLPNDSRVAIKLCQCLEAVGEQEKALHTAFKIHWEQPTFVPAMLAIGDLSYQSQNVEQAQKYWETALGQSQLSVEHRIHIGVGLWAIGLRKRSQALLREELTKCPVDQQDQFCSKVKQLMQTMSKGAVGENEIDLFLDLLF